MADAGLSEEAAPSLLSHDAREPVELQWIGIAFVLGLIARRLRQPPLLGFLAAGFLLELLGMRPDDSLRELTDVGLLLLLFAIGLKLDFRVLTSRPVLLTSTTHLGVSVGLGAALLALVRAIGVEPFGELDLVGLVVLAFALAFSSTVFAVKLLEERDDTSATYGRVAVGVLIVQDIVAVVFIAATKGEWPSPWSLALLGLIPLRPLLGRALRWCGHGELLVLAGLAAALGGAALFEAVGLKADLGALAAGALLGGHDKSRELAKSLMGLKEVFLVGFFLSVGLTGLPTLEMVGAALLLLLLLPLKGVLFMALLLRTRLRSRSALLSSFTLTNFSEFGLIVAAVVTSAGWLDESWSVVLAIAVGLSFVVSSLANGRAFAAYRRWRARLARLEHPTRLPQERAVDASWAHALVFGMGRIGAPAYDALREALGDVVVGFDLDERRVARHAEEGRRVHVASATDADFWERLHIDQARVSVVLLAMSSQEDNLVAIEQLRAEGYVSTIAATARFDDEVEPLEAAGADLVFRSLADAGEAFAARALASRT